MKQMNIQGVDYTYLDIGNDPAIIFAYGLFVDHSIFNQQITSLHDEHRYISVDVPGHGEDGYQPPLVCSF